MKTTYLTGEHVGNFGMVFITETPKRDKHGDRYGLFRCHCGQIKEFGIRDISRNKTKSCGCRRSIVSRQNIAKIPREKLSKGGIIALNNWRNSLTATQYSKFCSDASKKCPREACVRGGKIAGSMTGHVNGQRNGLANSLKASAHKRCYRGIWYRNTFEVIVASSLTKACMAFEYEQHTFDLGALGSYTPDFYVPSLDLWIEVKGRQFPSAMAKYERFAKTHNTLLICNRNMRQVYDRSHPARCTLEQIDSGVVPFAEFLDSTFSTKSLV